MIISSSGLLRMINISDKSYAKNQNTHFMFKNGAVHEVMWKSNVEPERQQMIVDACALRAGYQTIPTHTQSM